LYTIKTQEREMKKTTWVIIGLSVCVVALSIALVVVITQKKRETIIATEPDLFVYEPDNVINVEVVSKPWLRTFSIASDYTKTKSYYYGYYDVPIKTPGLDREVDFLGEKIPGMPHKVYLLKRWYETKEEKK
jgi:hypothetical protein